MIYKFGDTVYLLGFRYVFVAYSATRRTIWLLDDSFALKRYPSSYLRFLIPSSSRSSVS